MNQLLSDVGAGVEVAVEVFRSQLFGMRLTDGQMLMAAVLVGGMILQSLLMMLMRPRKARKPLPDCTGLIWITAGLGIIYTGTAYTRNAGEVQRYAMNEVLMPLLNALL